jgi:chemotaxis protein MotB
VSYADFITLLFAFFVVLFAATQNGSGKVKQVSASVRDALEHGQLSGSLRGLLRRGRAGQGECGLSNGPVRLAGPVAETLPLRPDLAQSMELLRGSLREELSSGRMDMKLQTRGLVVSMREAGFFASGDDVVNPASYPAIAKVAEVLRALPNPIRLEGHTDARPIHTSRFRSNWELSAARSIAMLELLTGRFGVERQRVAIAGYAENAPAGSNETEVGRAHNRRVDVVILSKDAVDREPLAAAK